MKMSMSALQDLPAFLNSAKIKAINWQTEALDRECLIPSKSLRNTAREENRFNVYVQYMDLYVSVA